MGELDATAAFEVYTQSAAARTVALAAGTSVRTRHGLVLLTTSTHENPSLSRIVVPGVADIDAGLHRWAASRHVDVESLKANAAQGDAGRNGGGFAAALQNLADHSGAVTATSTAKMIGYPTTSIDLESSHDTDVRAVVLVAASLALSVLVGLTPAFVSRRRRRAATRQPGTCLV